MADYEFVFMIKLHEKLKEKIVGRVFLKMTPHDEMYVNIRRLDGFDFDMYIKDFSTKILHGYSTDEAVSTICKEYRDQVLRKYFK